jgi:hypothetical protein
MIKNITSSSNYVTITGVYPPTVYNNGQVGVGNIRFNPANQSMEVYDGNMWQVMSGGVTVGLSYEADSAVRWAIEKQKAEAELQGRMEKNPGLKDAYEKFQLMDILTKEDREHTA